MPDLFSYPALLLLILCCTFFSLAEIGFAHVSPIRLRARAEKGLTGRVRIALYITEHYDRALIATLLGNNLANIGGTALATVIVISLLGEGYAWVASVGMAVLILLFGNIAPKQLALRIPERVCLFCAYPLRGLMVIFFPFIELTRALNNLILRLYRNKLPETPAVTGEELSSIIEQGEDEGVIDEDQAELLQGALDWGEVQAYEVLTPRVDMLAIDLSDPAQAVREMIDASPYSRLPVYRGTPDHIVGVLHLNHYYKALLDDPAPSVEALMMPVHFVHKTMPLPDVFDLMREKKCHLVVVNDEYGGTAGILTMEDVLEQIVGEIWDESDEVEEEYTELGDGRARVSGDMRIYDFFDEADCDGDDYDDDNATVGGFAMDMLEGEAEPGRSFAYKNLVLTVEKMDGRRIETLLVEHRQEEENKKHS